MELVDYEQKYNELLDAFNKLANKYDMLYRNVVNAGMNPDILWMTNPDLYDACLLEVTFNIYAPGIGVCHALNARLSDCNDRLLKIKVYPEVRSKMEMGDDGYLYSTGTTRYYINKDDLFKPISTEEDWYRKIVERRVISGIFEEISRNCIDILQEFFLMMKGSSDSEPFDIERCKNYILSNFSDRHFDAHSPFGIIIRV